MVASSSEESGSGRSRVADSLIGQPQSSDLVRSTQSMQSIQICKQDASIKSNPRSKVNYRGRSANMQMERNDATKMRVYCCVYGGKTLQEKGAK